MAGRFLRSRDKEFFDTVNKELVGDPSSNKSGVINQEIIAYKVSVYETDTNLYGEASSGKVYKNGIKLACIIEADDFDFQTSEFGPDLSQNASFSFIRQALRDVSFVPDIGDVFEWNYTFWEIATINENQLLAGMETNNHSVTCNGFLTDPTTVGLNRSRGY